jgi:hypothetical protein
VSATRKHLATGQGIVMQQPAIPKNMAGVYGDANISRSGVPDRQ